MDNQESRLNRFSMPLLATSSEGVRANATGSAQRFLGQLRADYRRVALPRVDLAVVEEMRQLDAWAARLAQAGVANCSVAILAVGKYLASDRSEDLVSVLKAWISADNYTPDLAWFENAFGPVVGPVVQLALDVSDGPLPLPGWADEVGEKWCKQFLTAGANELRTDKQAVPAFA